MRHQPRRRRGRRRRPPAAFRSLPGQLLRARFYECSGAERLADLGVRAETGVRRAAIFCTLPSVVPEPLQGGVCAGVSGRFCKFSQLSNHAAKEHAVLCPGAHAVEAPAFRASSGTTTTNPPSPSTWLPPHSRLHAEAGFGSLSCFWGSQKKNSMLVCSWQLHRWLARSSFTLN